MFDVQSKPGIEAANVIKMDTLTYGVSHEKSEARSGNAEVEGRYSTRREPQGRTIHFDSYCEQYQLFETSEL